MADKTDAKLQIMMALAIAIEYRKAPKTETNRRQLGGKNPNPSRKLKAKNNIKNTVEFAEMNMNKLQRWVRNRGLKRGKMEENEGTKLGFC